jgi:putative oxidoreductase
MTATSPGDNKLSAASNMVAGQERNRSRWLVGIWSAQILLALLFGAAGAMKVTMSPEALAAAGMSEALVLPPWLLHFIGLSELAGAFGVVVPTLTGIVPRLTPLAALGLATIQVLAIGFHLGRGEFAAMAPINLTLLGLSLIVLWGRTRRAPAGARW